MILFVSSKRNDYEKSIRLPIRKSNAQSNAGFLPNEFRHFIPDDYLYLYHEKVNKCLSFFIAVGSCFYDDGDFPVIKCTDSE